MAKEQKPRIGSGMYDFGTDRLNYSMPLLMYTSKSNAPKKVKTGPNLSDVFIALTATDLLIKGMEMQKKAEADIKNPYATSRYLSPQALAMYGALGRQDKENYGTDMFNPAYKLQGAREQPLLRYENGRLYHPGNKTLN